MWNKIRDWFTEYDDEITWFMIGSCNADGLQYFARGENAVGCFLLFLSTSLWCIYMKNLKGRK